MEEDLIFLKQPQFLFSNGRQPQSIAASRVPQRASLEMEDDLNLLKIEGNLNF